MTEDQKRKIQRLNQYSKKTERVEELELRISELKEDLYSPRIASYDLIVGGKRSTRNFSDRKEKLMDKIESLEHELILAMIDQAKESYFIFTKTSNIPNYNALLIYYRYLDRMTWNDVSSKLNKGLSTVHSLHRKTLDLLDI